MAIFEHTANDIIKVDGFSMPLSFFEGQEPAYTLPSPYIRRYYEQSVTHFVSDGITQVGAEFPYTNGNTYISKKSTYEAAYAAFLEVVITLETAKATKIHELSIYNTTKKEGMVIYDSNTYKSDNVFVQKIFYECAWSDCVGTLPSGYYVLDYLDNQITFTLVANLKVLKNLMIELYWECDKVFDTHKAAINALTTVEDVQAYDFTTGWPTVPYNPT